MSFTRTAARNIPMIRPMSTPQESSWRQTVESIYQTGGRPQEAAILTTALLNDIARALRATPTTPTGDPDYDQMAKAAFGAIGRFYLECSAARANGGEPLTGPPAQYHQ